MSADRWIDCPACQGEEGGIVDGDWVDCPTCQGCGGHTDPGGPAVLPEVVQVDYLPPGVAAVIVAPLTPAEIAAGETFDATTRMVILRE